MGFKIEARTQEWFDLAVERELPATITPEDAGAELRALAREERPSVVLKAWEEHDLLEAVNPVLAKKRPGYDAITRLGNVREDLFTAGLRPRLATPMLLAILARLKDREQSSASVESGLPFRRAQEVLDFDKIDSERSERARRKENERLRSKPIVFWKGFRSTRSRISWRNPTTPQRVSKIRAYLNKWRPIRFGLAHGGQ